LTEIKERCVDSIDPRHLPIATYVIVCCRSLPPASAPSACSVGAGRKNLRRLLLPDQNNQNEFRKAAARWPFLLLRRMSPLMAHFHRRGAPIDQRRLGSAQGERAELERFT